MITLLWKHFFEDDVESFRKVLEAASGNAASQSTRGGSGGKAASGGLSTSPGLQLGTSPSLNQRRKNLHPHGASSRAPAAGPLSRADLNWRDLRGVTLLHEIASSTRDGVADFAKALLEHPFTDLYIQDEESGWTALHRALYFGNITIAQALMERDISDALIHSKPGALHNAGGLIKIKDREGNSPFDVYGGSIGNRSIRDAFTTGLLGEHSDDDVEMAQGVTGDMDSDDGSARMLSARTQILGDEVFAFGSNKNFTLGFGDEDDRHFPERLYLRRPDHLLLRLYHEQLATFSAYTKSKRINQEASPTRVSQLPSIIQHKPIIIQDVQLSKLHSGILTADPEANLYMCGFGSGGRLGTGDETTRFGFVCICGGSLTGKKVIDVALGQDHTIAITSDGETLTWGSNTHGQLGYALNTTSQNKKDDQPLQLLPRQVYGPLKRELIVGASASRIHSVVFTPVSLYTFGKNDGQLGLVDSDARSLVNQTAPRKVAASLFSSTISAVSAIDKATVCLLDSHEVWVFANYGYTKVAFPFEAFSNYFLKSAAGASNPRMPLGTHRGNHIVKITSGGDTICAMSDRGDVFTFHVSQSSDASVTSTSTTNPSKIRGALSAPQRVWSLKKDHMAVRDVDVGQDGSIIISTESGSVWRRVKRAKIKDASTSGSSDYKPKDYKFSRVPRLTKVKAVRSNTFGGFAAIRRDCDVLKTQMEVEPNTLWKDVFPLLPFYGFGEEDSDTENPEPRFWRPQQQNDVASIRRAILMSPSLEDDMAHFLVPKQSSTSNAINLGTTVSDVRIPIHEFVFSGRSEPFRAAINRFRQAYFYSIPDVITLEYDKHGKIVVLFQGVDFITVLNLVLYLYTDAVVDVWHHTKRSPQSAFRYRQIRVELMKLASQLELRKLEHAARVMSEPPKSLHDDLFLAFQDDIFFTNCDLEIELDGDSVKVHSDLICQRCPFFEGLYHGRAGGHWLSSRRDLLQEPADIIKVDLKHIQPNVFQYVLQHIYADTDENMFNGVIAEDIDTFLDLVLDVMSTANELMLDRLSQCCQKILGRYVNTRNVCQLLNAVAPCSVTEFKDAALEYICLNLEGMLENRLLSEMDPEILLELDETVRENQMAYLPVARSSDTNTELLERYPELTANQERARQVKLDMVSLHSRLQERESKASAITKTRTDLLEDFETPASLAKSRRKSSGGHDTHSKSPLLRAKKSSTDLIFQMDDAAESDTEGKSAVSTPYRPRRPPTPSSKSPRFSTSVSSEDDISMGPEYRHPWGTSLSRTPTNLEATPDSLPGATPPDLQIGTSDRRVWASQKFPLPKSDLKDIMTQASSSKTSNITSSISLVGKSQVSPIGGQPSGKMSQRERKKQQRETLVPAPEAKPVQTPATTETDRAAFTTPVSPWRTASGTPKVNLKDVLDRERGEPQEPKEIPRAASPLTLRQTVSGRPQQTKRAASGPVMPSDQSSPAHTSRLHSAASKTPPSTSRSTSASAVSSQKAPVIQSIRHIPPPTTEPSQQMPLADILAQQQTEKQVVKDAVAKRSLQEIQQEQAFQEWWDQESAKTQMEAQESERQDKGPARRGRGVRRGRSDSKSRGAVKGGGRGKGKERDEQSKEAGEGSGTTPASSSSRRGRGR